MSAKVSYQVADFIALPVTFQSPAFGKKTITHYIYLKAYDPKIPDEESPRAIFAVNIPITSTETQLRHLFTSQLSSGGVGHVQRIYFAGQDGSGTRTSSSSSLIATTLSKPLSTSTTLGKRKRSNNAPSTSELSSRLATNHTLPSTSPSTIHATGSTAIIVFLDRVARDLALRACRKAARTSSKTAISWPNDDDTAPSLGRARYKSMRELTFPSRAELLGQVDAYMTAYGELESARARENAKLRSMPDEDGFVTVTRGSKGVAALPKEEEPKRKKRGAGIEGLDDFYRFQTRERRKEEQGRLLRQFEKEKRRVDEMRRGRGKIMPET